MKKKLLLLILIAFQSLTYAQDIISNGDFSDLGGGAMIPENVVDWEHSGLVYVAQIFSGNNTMLLHDIPYEGHDNDGRIFQEVEILEGVDYTFSMDFASGSPIVDDPFSFTSITVSLLSLASPGVETILTVDTESVFDWPINYSNVTTSFTPDQDFDFLFIVVDGFTWLEPFPNSEIGSLQMINAIANVSITWESPEGPNFHFENNLSVETETFCDGETVFLNAEASENVESYYIDALRRPISGGPAAEYSWFGSLGWTEDTNIGTLNLSSLFANAGMPFVEGYEYKIKLAISNDMSSWWENSHEFKYSQDPIPAMVFENETGTIQEAFCLGDSIFMDGTNSMHELKYRISISERPSGSNATFIWKGQTDWIAGSVGLVNLNSLFSNLGHQFSLGNEYKIQLIVSNDCDLWNDYVDYFDIISIPEPSFHFEDFGQHTTSQFCVAEEVFLDGSASLYEQRYRISIYERPLGSNTGFAWRGLSPWMDGEVGQVNLDDIYASFGYQFLGNHEYRVRLIVGNSCDGWEYRQRTFQMLEDCCFAPQNLSCSNHSGSNYLNWDPVPMAVSYIVEITYNDCCHSSLPQFTTQYLVKKELSLQVPNAIFDCFSWRVIVQCGHSTYYSEEVCYDKKTGCASAEFQEDDSQFRVSTDVDFKVYPNPASNYLNVSITDEIENGEMLLIDAAGRTIVKTTTSATKIDTESFESGIYFLLIKSGENILHRERVAIVK